MSAGEGRVDDGDSTADDWYTERLSTLSGARWKQLVPNPYRRNLRHMGLGRVLDVGCGIGRCLAFLDGNGVGVDHNPASVERCRELGLVAYTPDDLDLPAEPAFDTLLCSHVVEHMSEAEGVELLGRYLPAIRPGGRVLVITPQEAGQRSDPTHVRFVDEAALDRLLYLIGVDPQPVRSFPFPRPVGRVFRHNEFHGVGEVPADR